MKTHKSAKLRMSRGRTYFHSWCTLAIFSTVFTCAKGDDWMAGAWQYPGWPASDSSEEKTGSLRPFYGSRALPGYNAGYNRGYNWNGQSYNLGYNAGYTPGYVRYPWYMYNSYPGGGGGGSSQLSGGRQVMSGTAWGQGRGSQSADHSARTMLGAEGHDGRDSSDEDDVAGLLDGLLDGLVGGASSSQVKHPFAPDVVSRARGGDTSAQNDDDGHVKSDVMSSDDRSDGSDEVTGVVVGGKKPAPGDVSESSEFGDNDSKNSEQSGLRVTSYLLTSCRTAMDVAVLVDMSQRATAPDVTRMRSSLEDLVDQLHVTSAGRHLAVMTYGAQVQVTSALSGNAWQLKTDLARLSPTGGSPDMALALHNMRTLLTSQGRPGVSKACILITDERPSRAQLAARQAALARSAGVQMLVVAVGQDIDVDELRLVADDDDYHLLFAESYIDLAALTSLITSTLCPGKATMPSPQGTNPSTSRTTPGKITLPSTQAPRSSTQRRTPGKITLTSTQAPRSSTRHTTQGKTTLPSTQAPRSSTHRTTPGKITLPSTQTPRSSTHRTTPGKTTLLSTQAPRSSTHRTTPGKTTLPSTQAPRSSTHRTTPGKTTLPSTQTPSSSTHRTTPGKTTLPRTQAPRSSTQRTTSGKITLPRTQAPRSSTQRTTSGKTTLPRTQAPRSSTQRTTSGKITLPSTQAPRSSTQRTTSGKITLTSTQRPSPSSTQTTPKQETAPASQSTVAPPTTQRKTAASTTAPTTRRPFTRTPVVTQKTTTVSTTQRPPTPQRTSEKTSASTTQQATKASTPRPTAFPPLTVTSSAPEQTTPAQRIPEICDGCTMVNGVGYKEHWGACDMFVQCVFAADGSVTVSIRQCPHGLHWDKAALTCNRPTQARCLKDVCQEPGYVVYPATNNCRGFWACQGGVSEGKCCPPGHAFGTKGECTPSPSCQDPCGVSPTITNDVCDKRSVATMPLVFEQYVPGAGWQLMFCAPGTAYNHSQCSCADPGTEAFEPPECRPELYIPFNDDDARDESGNNNYVQNDGVKVVGGVGFFDGSGVLRVPRFSNSDYGDFLLVRLRYKQDSAGGGSQALVANGDCLKPSSLYLAADQQAVSFGGRTSTGQSPSVVVPDTSSGWKEVMLYMDRQMLTGSVNNFSKQTLFTGSLDSSKCALQIGRGTNFQNFKGFMDDITVYLCRPKTL